MEKNVDRSVDVNVWESQGKDTFVKCTTDWFSEKYPSRIHFSFVKHSGRDNGCKQLSHIEIGVPVLKAGSDGQGDTGITALQLASFIRSGRMRRRAEEARKAGGKYPPDIFTCIGGTPSRRSKDSGAEFRRFSIAPSTNAGQYVFKASRCEGEDSGTGGVQPKKGAQWETIMVRVSEASLATLGEYILAEWNAFRVASAVTSRAAATIATPEEAKSTSSKPAANSDTTAAKQEQNAASPRKNEKNKPVELTHVYVVVDAAVGVYGVSLSAPNAVALVRSATRTLMKEGYKLKSDSASEKLAQSILNEAQNPSKAWYTFELVKDGEDVRRIGVEVIRKVAP